MKPRPFLVQLARGAVTKPAIGWRWFVVVPAPPRARWVVASIGAPRWA